VFSYPFHIVVSLLCFASLSMHACDNLQPLNLTLYLCFGLVSMMGSSLSDTYRYHITVHSIPLLFTLTLTSLLNTHYKTRTVSHVTSLSWGWLDMRIVC